MKVLITGVNGFTGYYLISEFLTKGFEVIATGKGESRLPGEKRPGFSYQSMDFTDPFSVQDVFQAVKPGVVIHAGGMTRADDCEKAQWQAYVTNVEGTLNLLTNAEEHKSFFVFLSTEFVFDGEKGNYSEDDKATPVNFYGKTKLEAEDAVREYPGDWAIARTVLVYGHPFTKKKSFVSVIADKLKMGEEFRLFTDQLRTPTYAGDLAKGIAGIIEKKATGIYHLSGKDQLSPYDMGCLVAEHLGLDVSVLKPITAADYAELARRPANAGFNISKAKRKLGYQPLSFKEGLGKTFEAPTIQV